jgi:hypothetical protein
LRPAVDAGVSIAGADTAIATPAPSCRRDHASSQPASNRSITTASAMVPRCPSAPSSTNPVARAPTALPSVSMAYNRPSDPVIEAFAPIASRLSTGNSPPIRNAGTSSAMIATA